MPKKAAEYLGERPFRTELPRFDRYEPRLPGSAGAHNCLSMAETGK